jgi:ribosomal protein S12 methylthiotransferase
MGAGPAQSRQPEQPARVCLLTLGCPKNEADSRALMRSLRSARVAEVTDPEEATHIILNTCGFIQDAKEESIAAVLDACAGYPDKQVIVMGCLVERYREELARGIPEVSAWFGLVGGSDTPGLVELLTATPPGADAGLPATGRTGAPRERAARPFAGREGHAGPDRPPAQPRAAARPSYAYLKISDGCDELCTFCAIPAIKGPYYSIPAADILQEAGACLAEGARELVLVGQDTAVWNDGELDLAGLIDLLAADERVRRLRVMYLQPEHVTDGFLRYMAASPKLCRYLDVPFQHSHPDILRGMGRSGDGDSYLALLARARRLMPDVSVRSTFIVGYPGEREEHFEHLLRFVDEAGFDYAGGFVYSPEEGTAAAALRPRVRRTVAQQRLNRLAALLAARSEQRHQSLVGARVEVIIDSLDAGETEDDAVIARTAGQAPEVDGVTYVEGDLPEGTEPGDVIEVTVNGVLGYDLLVSSTGAGTGGGLGTDTSGGVGGDVKPRPGTGRDAGDMAGGR